ncbi:contact-dependent growth inhibition system immunity protein [Streptomyces sp. NPDC005548]|uniref:contact-dependent growth inhibition system immunity protein n=1 Tax=Streptomyces sp. NPDC005548 TaxID=3364724 RepID=UPI0036BA2388
MSRFTEFDFGVSWVMGFFHQDWIYEGDSAAEIVTNHLPDGANAYALAVRRDAEKLLAGLPSDTLEVLWTAGTQYLPGFVGVTGSEWTRTVIDVCDAWLSARADVHPLVGADTEDGLSQRDVVIAEIEGVAFLTVEVREALVDCARDCTPDLAFRVLLRAIVNVPDAALSADQYKRMESIGAALHYGEFVLDNVEFMVETP